MTKTLTYNVKDIFEDIDGDNENVLFKIPPEVAEKAGFVEGDIIKIEKHTNGGIMLTKVKGNDE